jgi:DNA-binding transcriptional LysR family regulator
MELSQVSYFITLARLLNFTRTAQECRISQPALTRSIQRLEAEIGGELLLRERAATQLTDLGRAMLPLFERVVNAAEIARLEARRLYRNERPALRLGMSPWLAFPLLAPVLTEVVTAISGTEFTVTVGSEEMLRESMLQGNLDILVAFRGDVFPERFDCWKLFTTVVTLIVPRGHALAAATAIEASQLAKSRFVGASEPNALPEIVLALLRRRADAGIESPHRANNWENALQLVQAGLGLGVGLSCWPVPPELAARPLIEPTLEHNVVLATLAGRTPSPAASAFIKLARARTWKPAFVQS